VGDVHEPAVHARHAEGLARLDDPHRHVAGEIRLGELRPQDGGREPRAPDRTAQTLPEVGHGTDMVLVRVGQHEPVQRLALLLDEAQVRQDDVHPGEAVVGEAEAEIDHQPAAGEAVEIGVHADLAHPAERHQAQVRK